MLNITIKDQKNIVTPEELANAMKAAAPVLERAKTGEETYADSQGWLDLEKKIPFPGSKRSPLRSAKTAMPSSSSASAAATMLPAA